MKTFKLAGLEPASVFGYFEKLCSMPHGSGNTKIISDYLVSFAKEQGIRYIQDELNNVLLFQDGTCGYEHHAPVILQGHMDMVCEKRCGLSHRYGNRWFGCNSRWTVRFCQRYDFGWR